MYELNVQESQSVSGGDFVIVTEEWKQNNAMNWGVCLSILGALGGGCVAAYPGASIPTIVLGSIGGAALYFGFGYGFSRLQDCLLENGEVYDIEYRY